VIKRSTASGDEDGHVSGCCDFLKISRSQNKPYLWFFRLKDIVEDQVLRKAQRGLLFGKPKFGIFVTAFYKKNMNVDDPSVHSGILGAACDVIKFALELEKTEAIGKEF